MDFTFNMLSNTHLTMLPFVFYFLQNDNNRGVIITL